MKAAACVVIMTMGLGGCMGGAAGVVTSQVATAALTNSVTSNNFVNRFRRMDCDTINGEIERGSKAITNPLVGDGGYMAAAKQVAAEKGC